MKKIVDDLRLIYKCCCLYYIDEMSQQEICDHIGISRATVSRMLKLGKEKGIVNIEINNPINLSYGQLERQLEKKYGLKEVVIVDNLPLDTKDDLRTRINEEAFRYFSRLFKDKEYVGLSMGSTLDGVIRTNQTISEKIDCTFVPVVGGISPNHQSGKNIHANNVAISYAQKFGGKAIQFFAPALFTDIQVMNGFMKEKPVQEVLDYYSKLSTIVMGVGVPGRRASTLVEQGYIKKDKLQSFVNNGAVGDILLKFYDGNGKTDKFDEFNSRVSGLLLEQLKFIENRVCIAFGNSKEQAILGAIRGEFINILITDLECAEALMSSK